MWDSGAVCDWELYPNWAFHSCDTAPGMSGSAVQTVDHKVVGVHGYGFPAMDKNGAVMLDKTYLKAVIHWAGIAHQSDLLSRKEGKEGKEQQRPTSRERRRIDKFLVALEPSHFPIAQEDLGIGTNG